MLLSVSPHGPRRMNRLIFNFNINDASNCFRENYLLLIAESHQEREGLNTSRNCVSKRQIPYHGLHLLKFNKRQVLLLSPGYKTKMKFLFGSVGNLTGAV